MKAPIHPSRFFCRAKPCDAARPGAGLLVLATVTALLWPGSLRPAGAAGITFKPPVTISNDNDIYIYGSFRYAYDLANTASTVNGVPFAAANSTSSLGGGNVTLSGYTGTHNTAFGSGSGAPWNTLSAAYQTILRGGVYNGTGGPVTTHNLNNLTAGHQYVVQFWVHDNRSSCCFNRTETVTGINTVTLAYNNTKAGGGVGQFTLGYFTAEGASQSFTADGDESTQMNAIQLRDVTGSWDGLASSDWDSASVNFSGLSYAAVTALGVTNVFFADKDAFGNAPATTTVTIPAGGVTGANVNFQNLLLDYTLNSSDGTGFTGAFTMSKIGGALVTLNGAHTFTGPTTISGGALRLNDANALQNSTVTLAVNNGLTFGAGAGGAFTLGGLSGAANLALQDTAAGAVTLSVGNNGQSTTFSGNLTGPGGLTKTGTGSLTLNGANTYSGSTLVAGGTLALTTRHQGGGALTVADGATLRLAQLAVSATVPAFSLTLGSSAGSTLQFTLYGGPTAAPLTASNLTVNAPVSIAILSAGFGVGTYPLLQLVNDDITVKGPFVLTSLPAGMTASLVTNALDNTLELNVTAYDVLTWAGFVNGNWDLTTANWQAGGVPAIYNEIIPPGPAVRFDDSLVANPIVNLVGTLSPVSILVSNVHTNYAFTGSGSLAGSTTLTKDGTGALTNSTANSYSGGTVIRAGSVFTGVAGGLGTAAVAISNGATLNLTAGGTTYTGPNAGLSGAGTVNVAVGTGTQTVPLNGVNSNFTGVLNVGLGAVAGAGKVQLNGPLDSAATVNALVNGTVYVSASGVVQPAALFLYGGDTGETLGQIRMEGNANWTGPVTLAGDITTGNDANVGCNSGTGFISGSIGELGGPRALLKGGAGTLVLAGANTFTGPTGVRAGTLRLAHPLALQFSTLTNSVAFDAAVLSRAFTLGGLGGASNLGLSNTANAPITLSVGNNGSSATYGGVLTGPGSLTKIGSGRLTLSAVSIHTGPTRVEEGILQLAANGGINNNAALLVGPGGILDVSPVAGGFVVRPNQTLGGFGVVTGSVAAGLSAILAPGADGTAGTLRLHGPLGLTNATLKFDLANVTTVGAGVNDLLALNGPLSLNGSILVQPTPLDGDLAAGTYTLMTGITSITGGDASNFLLPSQTRQTITFAFVDAAAPGVSGVTNLEMTVAGSSASLVWAGVGSLWDVGVSFNWTNPLTGQLDPFFQLDRVRFDDTLASNATVTLVGSLAPVSLIVSNMNTNYAFIGAGGIAGLTSLIKEGPGTLTLGNVNSHQGGTAVRGGTVIVGNASALGPGPADVSPGAVLQLESPATTTFANAFTGAGLLRLNFSGGVNNTYVNNVTGFTGLIELTNPAPTGNKWNVTALGTIPADVLIHPGSQLFVPGGTNVFRSIAVSGTGNTENRGAIRVGGFLGGPLILRGDTAIGSEGGTIAGDITSGAPGLQTLTVGTASSTGNATLSGTIGGGLGTIGLTKLMAGTLTLAGANTYTGPTTIGGGTVVLAATGSISNTASIHLAPGTTLNASAAGGLALGLGQSLSGSGTVLGIVRAGDGSQLVPGGGVIGTLTLNNGLSLSNAGALDYQLASTTTEGGGVNDLLLVNGDLALTGVSTVRVAFAGAPAIGQPYTLIRYTGTLVGDAANLTVFNETRLSFALDFSAPNQVRLIVTGSPGNLLWVGGNPDNTWDTRTTANWDPGTGNPDVFFAGDTVRFENGAFFTTVNLAGVVQPADVNMIADDDYVFEGSGWINGGRLNKSGSGLLTLANTAVNTFAGGTFVTGGTLQIGNGGTAGALPDGPVVIDTTLVFNRSDDLVVSNAIAGAGLVRKQNTNTVILSGANTHGAGTVVEAGMLRLQNSTALGNVASAVTIVSNGATLDLGTAELWNYQQPIILNGPGVAPALGALTKSTPGVGGLMHIRSLILDSDTSIGGVPTARIDIGRGDWPGPVPVGPIHLDGQGHTLSLVGNVYLGILAGAQNLAGVIVNSGTFVAPHNDNSFGEAVVTLNGGTLTPWGANHVFSNQLVIQSGFINNQGFMHAYNGPVQVNGPLEINTIAGGNITFSNAIAGAGSITKIGAFSLMLAGDNSGFTGAFTNNESNSFFDSATAGSSNALWVLNAGTLSSRATGLPTIHLGALAGAGGLLGNNTPGETVTWSIGALGLDATFAGNIVDTVGGGGVTALAKVGAGTQTLSGTNSYTAGTLVSEGTLIYDGVLFGGAGPVVVAGGTLAGHGTLMAPVQVQPGGTLAPGASIGTLTISNTLTLAGTNVMEIEADTLTSDLVRGLTSVTYGGTLVVRNLDGTFSHGDTFKLFDAAAYAGSFAVLQLPALPPGHVWDTSGLTRDGTLAVVTNRAPVAAHTNVSTTVNHAAVLSASTLAAMGSDPDGDLLAVVSVSNTTNGGTVTLLGDTITCTPVADFVGVDRFTYTLSDGRGGFATATVEVLVYPGAIPALHVLSPQRVGGDFQFTVAGLPGRTYQVERALEVSGPWSNIATVVSGPTGLTGFVDTNAPAGSAFYRMTHP